MRYSDEAATSSACGRSRKAASAAKGLKRGIGYSSYIEACGIAPSKAVGSLGAGVGLWESAEVRVNPVGTIEINVRGTVVRVRGPVDEASLRMVLRALAGAA